MREKAMEAVRRYAAMDPSSWHTGLSDAGARRALREACELLLASRLAHAQLPHGAHAPKELLIWCAGNVFTVPLEWVALFHALGSRVTLKAPTGQAEPLHALAAAFGEKVRVVEANHEAALALLSQADAVLAFGSTETMEALNVQIPLDTPRSLHGHRVSFAVVDHLSSAEGIALDAALYDGQGCMSPAAVFCTTEAEKFAEKLAMELMKIERELPRGPLDPALGPEWRRRAGLARSQGRLWSGESWAVGLAPMAFATLSALPRFIMVHPIQSLDQLAALRSLPLSTCATDRHDLGALSAAGFWRLCRPGHMQLPPPGRPHDGVDVRAVLCRAVSLETR